MLGEGFEVTNFGCSGTTLLKNGNSPYWNTKEYTNAKAFLPNIVIVKLGSNDSKSGNWSSHGSEFESDLNDLVLPYGACQLVRGSFLCTPAIAYSNSFGIDDGIITSEIIPAIQRVAEAQNLTVIDLHTALRGYGDLFLGWSPPRIEGNRVIATIIYDVLAKEYS